MPGDPDEATMTESRTWPIVVISLTDCLERRASIAAQFDALGVDFKFFNAVDGRKGLPPEHESNVDRAGTIARYGYPMSDGEYACALSHQQVYKWIIDEGLPGAIILEDDAILTHRFADFIRDEVYLAGDLVQLFYFQAHVWRVGRKVERSFALSRLAGLTWMTAAYSISARGAAILRQHSLPLTGRADWPCDTYKLLDHYIVSPRPVLHPIPARQLSTINKQSLIPENFDFSAGYAKGWRRLYSVASWRRLARRPWTQKLEIGFDPRPDELASIVCDVQKREFG